MSRKKQQPQYLTFGEFVKRVVAVVFVIAMALALWKLRTIILMGFLSVIIAVSLSLIAVRLQHFGLKRGYSIAATMTLIATIFILLGLWLLPITVTQMVSFFSDLPAALDMIMIQYDEWRESSPRLQRVLPEADVTIIQEALGMQSDDDGEAGSLDTTNNERGLGSLSGIVPIIRNSGPWMLGQLANLLVVVIVALYLLLDPRDYAKAGLMLVPTHYQPRFAEVMAELRRTLTAWLASISLSISVTVVLVYIGLGLILGVPNAIALALIAGLATIIPNIGAIIPIVPITIFTLADDPKKLPFVILMYFVIQQLESTVITPFFVKKQLNIPAGAMLLFQLIAATLFGFLGVLLAVPLLAVLVTLVRELYVYDILGMRGMEVQIEETPEGDLVVDSVPKPEEEAKDEFVAVDHQPGDGEFVVTTPENLEEASVPEIKQKATNSTDNEEAVDL